MLASGFVKQRKSNKLLRNLAFVVKLPPTQDHRSRAKHATVNPAPAQISATLTKGEKINTDITSKLVCVSKGSVELQLL